MCNWRCFVLWLFQTLWSLSALLCKSLLWIWQSEGYAIVRCMFSFGHKGKAFGKSGLQIFSIWFFADNVRHDRIWQQSLWRIATFTLRFMVYFHSLRSKILKATNIIAYTLHPEIFFAMHSIISSTDQCLLRFVHWSIDYLYTHKVITSKQCHIYLVSVRRLVVSSEYYLVFLS